MYIESSDKIINLDWIRSVSVKTEYLQKGEELFVVLATVYNGEKEYVLGEFKEIEDARKLLDEVKQKLLTNGEIVI